MPKVKDIWCAEEFVNVSIDNVWGYTMEEVADKPIIKEGIPIGVLQSADEELIYGIVWHVSDIYDQECACEMGEYYRELRISVEQVERELQDGIMQLSAINIDKSLFNGVNNDR